MQPINNKRKGFTLIELMVIVAIITIMIGMVLVVLSMVRTRGQDAKRQSDIHQIKNALGLYYASHYKYPTNGAGNPMTIDGGASDYLSPILISEKYLSIVSPDPDNVPPQIYTYQPSSDAQSFELRYRVERTGEVVIVKP